MADYFSEHSRDEEISDDRNTIARFLIESGWSQELALSWEHLFPEKPKAASPEFLAKLERIFVKDSNQDDPCSICLSAFDATDEIWLIRMPCNHLFHQNCLLPWLKLTNTCPSCRIELPTVNPLYETYKKQEERKKARAADLEELHSSMYC